MEKNKIIIILHESIIGKILYAGTTSRYEAARRRVPDSVIPKTLYKKYQMLS